MTKVAMDPKIQIGHAILGMDPQLKTNKLSG